MNSASTIQRTRLSSQRTQKSKSLIGATLVLLAAASLSPAFADGRGIKSHSSNSQHTFTDYADVVDVHPIYRTVTIEEPRKECWYEKPSRTTVYEGYDKKRHQRSNGHSANPVVGGIIGGAIGNQIGRHTGSREGRIGATIAGVVIGSVIGNESSGRDRRERRSNRDRRNRYQHNRRQHIEQTPVERCRVHNVNRQEQHLEGYKVTYRYQGRNYSTQMAQRPGRQIPLKINIRPQRN